MRLTKASTSGLLITAGLAQLLIALCAVSYFLYLRGDAHTETSVGSAVNAALADAPTPETTPQASQLVPRAAPLGIAATVIRRALKEDSGVQLVSVAAAREPQQTPEQMKSPECAHVRITSDRTTFVPGDKIRFVFQIISAPPGVKFTDYAWHVNTGQIVSGQGTDSIIVDTANADEKLYVEIALKLTQDICVEEEGGAVLTAVPSQQPKKNVPTVVVPTAAATTGGFAVNWPRTLTRGEKGEVSVSYTPPTRVRSPGLTETYSKVEALISPKSLTGLTLLDPLRPSKRQLLNDERLVWRYRVRAEGDAPDGATCDMEVAMWLTVAETGEVLELRPVQLARANIGSPAVPPNFLLLASAFFVPAGGATLGLGLKKRKRGARDRAVCHFNAEMDEEVSVGHVAELVVTVSREELKRIFKSLRENASRIFVAAASEVDPSTPLLIQVLPRANFKVVGRDSFPVIPPGPGESASISFEVQPTHAPEGEVWVVVWQNQSLLATLALKPRIVEAEIKVSRKTSATASAAEASPPDAPLQRLVIMEEQRGSETFFNFVLHAPALDIEDVYPSMPIKGDRREYVENLYRQIEDYWESNRDEAEAFAAELRAFGGQLFRELFPTDLQRVLWERRQEIKSIMVLSTEPFIPWELVHLKEPGRAGMPSEELFLGQMGLVRWLFGAGTAPLHMKIRKGRVCYVIPQYPDERYRLPEAEMESEFLRATFNAAEVEPQPNPVRELISRPGGFDLLHFACHGAAEQNNISNGRLLLEGDMKGGEYEPAFLSATTAEQYSNLRAADNRPMVVVNACQAGRAGYKLSGIGGFAQAFLKGGAGAFVGTLWSVGDRPARVFTETLYAELLRGANLSEAATIARRAARQEGVATWLAYVVYGHPHMRVND